MGWPDAMWLKKQLMGSGNQEITTNTVVTITQIPNNQYGFFIKLTDIDGETPLSDVVVTGVTDPSSELRTNAMVNLNFIPAKQPITYLGQICQVIWIIQCFQANCKDILTI